MDEHAAIELAALLRRIETGRRVERVEPREGDDFQAYDQLVFYATVEIDGIEHSRTAATSPALYPEAADVMERMTAEQLARDLLETHG
jgi:hypothetical protein